MIDLLSTVTDYYQCYWKRLKSFGRNSTLTPCCLYGIKGAVSRNSTKSGYCKMPVKLKET